MRERNQLFSSRVPDGQGTVLRLCRELLKKAQMPRFGPRNGYAFYMAPDTFRQLVDEQARQGIDLSDIPTTCDSTIYHYPLIVRQDVPPDDIVFMQPLGTNEPCLALS